MMGLFEAYLLVGFIVMCVHIGIEGFTKEGTEKMSRRWADAQTKPHGMLRFWGAFWLDAATAAFAWPLYVLMLLKK